jgi:hypothetical protein
MEDGPAVTQRFAGKSGGVILQTTIEKVQAADLNTLIAR